MRRIDTPSAAQNLFGPGKHGFRNGTPESAVLATRLSAAYFNATQEELANLVEAGGLALDSGNNSQVLRVIRGGFVTLSASTSLTPAHAGLVLLDASGGSRTFTLPSSVVSTGPADYLLRRVDGTANALVIAADGTEKIMLDTATTPAGQAATELLFAGDYLRLRSDGSGKWWCLGQAHFPGSLASGLVVISTVGVSTYNVSPILRSGRRIPKVIVVGGGGGASKISGATGNGGGGGGTSIGRISLAGVSSVPCTIGTPGAGKIGSAGAGINGGSSSFGSYLSSGGGGGGASVNGRAGGGNSDAAADIRVTGQRGESSVGGGNGGCSLWGVAGVSAGISATGTAGESGSGFGSGGGGGSNGSDGADGTSGVIILEW